MGVQNNADHMASLPERDDEVRKNLLDSRQLLVYCCTWNLAGKPWPADLRCLFRGEGEEDANGGGAAPWRPRHHIYAIGSEECERGIVASLMPGGEEKSRWEAALHGTLGVDLYTRVESASLGATHLVVFAHREVFKVVGTALTSRVPCGIANVIGNKGGVAVSMNVGNTRFLFVNCHLAAGQSALKRRNADWARIDANLQLTSAIADIENKIAAEAGEAEGGGELRREEEEEDDEDDDASVGGGGSGAPGAAAAPSGPPPASQSFDRVVWMGDLNYRLGKGKKAAKDSPRADQEGATPAALPSWDRAAVDALVASNSIAELVKGDQLLFEQAAGRVAVGFSEGPLGFPPTYKFDVGTDAYDSGPKRRVPSYTDRILFRAAEGPPAMQLLSYRSISAIKTSDHRPVVAEFSMALGGGSRRRGSSFTSSSAGGAAAAAASGSSGGSNPGAPISGRASRASSFAAAAAGSSSALPPLSARPQPSASEPPPPQQQPQQQQPVESSASSSASAGPSTAASAAAAPAATPPVPVGAKAPSIFGRIISFLSFLCGGGGKASAKVAPL